MKTKTLKFDAQNVEINSRTHGVINVEIETTYLNEVLDEFDCDEIIQNYTNIDNLYKALKEYFTEDS